MSCVSYLYCAFVFATFTWCVFLFTVEHAAYGHHELQFCYRFETSTFLYSPVLTILITRTIRFLSTEGN